MPIILNYINNKSNEFIAVCLFISAFLIRLIFSLVNESLFLYPIEDQAAYHNIATDIASVGFIEANLSGRPIFLPAFLSFFYYIFPFENNFVIARFLSLTVSSITIILIYFNSKLLINDKNFALFVSIIFCLYPPSIFYSSLILTENYIILFFLIFSFLFLKFNEKSNNIYYFIIGIILGLITLTKSAFLLFPFYFFGIIILIKIIFKQKISIIKIFLLFIAYLTILTPLTIRNYYVHDSFIPTTTRLGYMLWLSNHDLSENEALRGGYIKNQNFQNILDEVRNNYPVKDRSRQLTIYSLEEINNNKKNFAIALLNRGKNYLSYRPNPYKNGITTNDLIMMCIWMPILLFSVLGLLRKKSEKEVILWIIITYSFLIHLFFWGMPRFRFPTDPYFLLLASLTIKHYMVKKTN